MSEYWPCLVESAMPSVSLGPPTRSRETVTYLQTCVGASAMSKIAIYAPVTTRTHVGIGVEDRELVMVSSAGESPGKW